MEILHIFFPLLGAIVVLLVLAKLSINAANEDRKASESDGRLEFAPNRSNFWGVSLFVASLGYVVIAGLAAGFKSTADLIVPSFCAAFIVLLTMAFPGTIVVDQDGIEQRYWLRGRKRVAWKDVAKVTVDAKRGELKIKSRQGLTILHSRQLPDAARLLRELDERCTQKLTPNEMPVTTTKTYAMSGPAA